MSDEEVDRLARFLGLTPSQTIRRHCRMIDGRISLKENRDARGEHPCIFLIDLGDGRRGCGIYPVRPLQCRTWPFWEGNLESEKAWKRTKKKCPGLDTGRPFSADEIVALRDAENWPEQTSTPTSERVTNDVQPR
jgi:hypothetical protein